VERLPLGGREGFPEGRVLVVLLVVSDIFGGTWGFYLGVNRVNLEKICGKLQPRKTPWFP
jgi:hypothetical protein